MLVSRFSLSLFLFAFVSGSLHSASAQQIAAIEVTPGRVLGPVNRLVFGQNLAGGDNAHIFSSDTTDPNLIQRGLGLWDPAARAPVVEVMNDAKAIKATVFRYPGGCYAHNFDWRKTVGPDAKKAGWLFGLDEYLSVCQAAETVPLITLSDYALPSEQMPENAAQLVEYLNSPADAAHPWAEKRKEYGHPEPYNVTWFEIGNESMHGNHRVLPHRQYSPEQYAAYANATAAAIRKVDPRVKLGLVMMPGPGTDIECDWNETVLRMAGASADFAIIHMYAPQGPMAGASESVRMQTMMVAPQHIEERLREYHQLIRSRLGHDLPLAITEFDGVIDQPTYGNSLADALECADLLRVFLKPEMNIAMANYWDFVNGSFGIVRTNMRSGDGKPEITGPAFLVYKLWADHFGSRLVAVNVAGPKADFPGAGTESADRGDTSEPRRQIQRIDLNQFTTSRQSQWNASPEYKIEQQDSTLTIHLNNLNGTFFQALANIPRPQADPATPIELAISFDAQFVADPGSPDRGNRPFVLGIGVIDSRGWKQTHSGIGVDGITSEFKHFDATYRFTPDTPSVDLSARMMADGANLSGTVQIHNLKVTEFTSGHDVDYPLLTGSASVSSDGKTTYLIVFNKSLNDPISANIHLANSSAATAKYWEVNGPSLASGVGVTETQQAQEIPLNTASSATHVFPPHSMTAIEFRRESTGR